MKLSPITRAGSAVAIGALALTLAACGSDNPTGASSADTSKAAASDLSGELSGAGASSQESAMEAWRAGFQDANPGVTVNYDPVGSGGGRTQLLSGGVPFAGSDAALTDEEMASSTKVCGPDGAIDLPVYISPIAVVFNVKGIDALNLAPATIAGIFTGKITKWNDAAIAADNPGVDLPATAITPVHRSDSSGTTQNFTDYLAQTAPSVWTTKASGDWPTKTGESAQGTSGVVQTVTSGDGTIAYADASQAGKLGVAKIKVGDQWVSPSADGAAKVVQISPKVSGRHANDMSIAIDRTTTEAGTYPLTLVSYQVVCQQYKDKSTADLVKALMTYIVSPQAQQAAAAAAGNAPLSDSLSKEAATAISAIKAA